MNSLLYGKILQLLEMVGIVLLNDRDRPAGTCNVNVAEPGIEFRHVGTLGNREKRDGLVRIHVKDGQEIVSLADQKRTMVRGIERHAVVSLATAHRISGDHSIRRGIDYREGVLVLQVHINLARDWVV